MQSKLKKHESNKLSWMEKIAFNYFKANSNKHVADADAYHIMNENEQRVIRDSMALSLFVCSILGVWGVIVLYLPQYFFPSFFADYPFYIAWLDYTWDIPITTTIYGTILVYIEIYCLFTVQIWAVRKIAHACGYLNINHPEYSKNVRALIAVGLEKKERKLLSFGLNPYEGISKVNLLLFTLIMRLKATISNYAVKLILRRFLGRIVLRQVVDMAGIPIFAFWNAWAAYIVIREAKVRIMASSLTDQLVDELYEKHSNDENIKQILYESLQYIAVSKRDFHHNHYFLADKILNKFQIPKKEKVPYNQKLPEKIQSFSPAMKSSFIKLILFGMLVDGSLSKREKKIIHQLHAEGYIPVDLPTVKRWTKEYMQGKGLNELFAINF